MMAEMDCRFGKLQSGAQPIRDPMVVAAVRSMDMGRLTERSYDARIVEDFTDAYDSWIRSSRLNRIEGFDAYGRHMSFAVTNAIEQFLMKHRGKRIRTFKGEYPGTMELIRGYDLTHSHLDNEPVSDGDAVLVSAPFSGSGNQHPMMDSVLDSCDSLKVPVMVDCAFFGICKGLRLERRGCIETVAFSLSKCYCIHFHRVGMVYSIDPPAGIEVLNRFGYTPRFGAAIAMDLLDAFGPDHAYTKYAPTQAMVCEELGDMSPSDTVLFGNGGETWRRFDRGGGHNRVSFGAFLPELLHEENTNGR